MPVEVRVDLAGVVMRVVVAGVLVDEQRQQAGDRHQD